MKPRYLVITPARNEEAHLLHTIRSMVGQNLRPIRWVIVNDGSTDRTAAMIDDEARKHDWIVPVHRNDRGYYKPGGGVVETFYEGYKLIQEQPWEFVAKLDADLSFEPDYFERCLEYFKTEPQLGIGGGTVSLDVDGHLQNESPSDPAFHVRGPNKIYRRECWEAIGGLFQAPGWDTIDELKANMLGWTTRTFHDIQLCHHRATGSTDGTWKNSVKFGLCNYISGYHPMFMLAKCAKRLFQPPYFVGAVGLAWGFCKGYLHKVAQVDDPDLIQYVRRQQLNKLLLKPSLW
jgi:glycosyltransferase involved in cell wall biosynthesis